MNGFACDRCGRGLLTDADVRYVVKIELVAAYDPLEITREDLARDHDREIDQILAQLGDMDEEEINSSVHKTMKFDLCATCRRPFLANPLGRQEQARDQRSAGVQHDEGPEVNGREEDQGLER